MTSEMKIFSVDEAYMRMALSLAEYGLGRVWPNPSVGCVIVKDGVHVGMGTTADGGRPHAETQAIEAAGERVKGATAYVTLEPCNHRGKTPPCSQALIDAGVARVVVACLDPDPRTAGQGIAALEAARIEVVTGLCEEQALSINQGFFLRLSDQRPMVTLKKAVSSDGMIASAPGVHTQISGEQAHEYLHHLRSTYDAIAVGISTVLADDPMLTARVSDHEHSIVRIVFDSSLQIPPDSKLVQTTGNEPLWVCHKDGASEAAKAALIDKGVKLIQTGACVSSALNAFADEGITRLLVEGGAKLHGSFIHAGLVDEAQVLSASHALGSGGVAAADFDPLGFECVEKETLGEDLLEIYRPAP